MNLRRTDRSFPLALALLAALWAPAPSFAQSDPGLTSLDLPEHPIVTGIQVTDLHGGVPCVDDSVRVVITGLFGRGCYAVRGVQVVPIDCTVPCAPRLIVRMADQTCFAQCLPMTTPWRVEARYGPLPAGRYDQAAAVEVGPCLNTDPPYLSPALSVPFAVRPESLCTSLPGRCLMTDWRDPEHTDGCDGTLDEQGRARVAMRVRTPVALRGLQGRLRLTDSALVVRSVAPMGPAAGMTMVWTPTRLGAEFVMFATGDERIPPSPNSVVPPAVLGVEVATREGHTARSITYLFDDAVEGADESSATVPHCPIMTLELRAARICAEASTCDANRDGRISVSDLVAMVSCLNTSCPDSLRFDCDGDHDFGLDDILCCARRLLRGNHPPGDPVRPGDGLRVGFGEPSRTAQGWRVPLELEGVAQLGAARLLLRFPGDRFEFAGLTQRDGASSWLSLVEPGAAELSVGLLNLGIGTVTGFRDAPIQRLALDLDLRLRDGQAPGGEVGIAEADLSSVDGEALAVPLPPGVRIPAGVSLSPGRPNPFTGVATFVLGLAQDAEVTVTVHDVNGRRVATLLEGRFTAGSRELRWNGRDDANGVVPDGVYFVRAASRGQVVTAKVVRLRDR